MQSHATGFSAWARGTLQSGTDSRGIDIYPKLLALSYR
jgi:hypothetical protein